jgi:hypothetical protein
MLGSKLYLPPAYKFDCLTVNFDLTAHRFYAQAQDLTHEQIVERIETNTPIILDFTRDHAKVTGNQSIPCIKEYFDQQGYTNLYYLTCDMAEDDNDRIVFFPVWVYSKSIAYTKGDWPIHNVRQYKVSSLNRFPSAHRVYLYYALSKQPYFNEMMLSFYGLRNPYLNGANIELGHSAYHALPADAIAELKDMSLYREAVPGDSKWDNDHSFTHQAFLNSYLNIISESTAQYHFFSEKTCKPLAAGQFFLSVNGTNSTNTLRTLGFDCFDEVFNNHSHEQHASFVDRIDSMLAMLAPIYEQIELLYWDRYARAQYNKQYFMSDDFRNKLLKPLRDRDLLLNTV